MRTVSVNVFPSCSWVILYFLFACLIFCGCCWIWTFLILCTERKNNKSKNIFSLVSAFWLCIGTFLLHLARPFHILFCLHALLACSLKISQRWKCVVFSGLLWAHFLPCTLTWFSSSFLRGLFSNFLLSKDCHSTPLPPLAFSACVVSRNCYFAPVDTGVFIWLSVSLRNALCIVRFRKVTSYAGNRPLRLVLRDPTDGSKQTELSWEHKRNTVLREQDPVCCGQDEVPLRKQDVLLKTHHAQVVDTTVSLSAQWPFSWLCVCWVAVNILLSYQFPVSVILTGMLWFLVFLRKDCSHSPYLAIFCNCPCQHAFIQKHNLAHFYGL